jgi:hypothetical protein
MPAIVAAPPSTSHFFRAAGPGLALFPVRLQPPALLGSGLIRIILNQFNFTDNI